MNMNNLPPIKWGSVPREGGEGPKEFFHFLLGGKEFGTIKIKNDAAFLSYAATFGGKEFGHKKKQKKTTKDTRKLQKKISSCVRWSTVIATVRYGLYTIQDKPEQAIFFYYLIDKTTLGNCNCCLCLGYSFILIIPVQVPFLVVFNHYLYSSASSGS